MSGIRPQAENIIVRRAVQRAGRAHRQRAARRIPRIAAADRRDLDFITHSIEEALALGERLMVFERPARIAYEAMLRADMSEAERDAVRSRIRNVLFGEAEAAASGAGAKTSGVNS